MNKQNKRMKSLKMRLKRKRSMKRSRKRNRKKLKRKSRRKSMRKSRRKRRRKSRRKRFKMPKRVGNFPMVEPDIDNYMMYFLEKDKCKLLNLCKLDTKSYEWCNNMSKYWLNDILNNHDKLKRFLNSLPKAASDLQRFRVACNFIKKGISPKRVRKLLTESRKLSEKNEKRWPNKNLRFL